MKDLLQACLMRLSGDKSTFSFPLSSRPEDELLAQITREQARKAREKVTDTKWEAI